MNGFFRRRCVPMQRVCDGVRHCNDGSDEADCREIGGGGGGGAAPGGCEFRCAGGACLGRERQCDGYPDCPEGDDEQGCPQYQCRYRCNALPLIANLPSFLPSISSAAVATAPASTRRTCATACSTAATAPTRRGARRRGRRGARLQSSRAETELAFPRGSCATAHRRFVSWAGVSGVGISEWD